MGLPSSVDGVTKLVGADAGTVGARTGGHPRERANRLGDHH